MTDVSMRIAFVTGASSGLGRDFVLELAGKERGLEEIWVVARREHRLSELKRQCPVPLRIFPLDLTCEESLKKLQLPLDTHQPDIAVLINAAGYGRIGNYRDLSASDSLNMIDLNCKAAVAVTLLCLPFMHRGGRILEICSTAAFQPFPYLNLYAASKAFLYRYSRGLRRELFGRGILVTAVCPYWIKDTEFIANAKQSPGKHAIRHFPLASRSNQVAKWALLDSRLGLSVSTPGPICMIHRIAAKLLPSWVMMDLWEVLRRL